MPQTPSRAAARAALSLASSLAATAAAAASPQSIIVPDDTVHTVVSLAHANGALEATGFMDLDDGAIAPNRPYEAAVVGNEIWFTDDVTGRVTRWNSFGTVQLGSIDLTPHRLRGITAAFGSVWVAAGNPSQTIPDFLAELTPGGSLVALHPMPGLINGVAAFGTQLLVANADVDSLLLVDPATGAVTGTFHASNGVTGIDLPGDIDVLPNGHVLCAGSNAPPGIYEYDALGNQVRYHDTSSLPLGGGARGVHGLTDGNVAFTAASAIYRYEVATGAIVRLVDSLTAYYIAEVPTVPIGTSECSPATVNSTGRPATISAVGSAIIANRAVRLCAQDLPIAAPGYFLASRTANFVPNAGGSQGNLCLGGSIGRYVQNVQFSANDGFYSMTVDPFAVPQPVGTVAVLAGETWRFQSWFRDQNPTATSNFTNVTAVTFQ